MSVTAADVERWARALGVWLGMREPWERGSGGPPWRLTPLRDGLTVAHPAVGTSVGKHVDVDPLTAALILLGHARGLRVDVGECLACRERGSKRGLAMWEWAQRLWAEPWPGPHDATWTHGDPPLADWTPGSVSEFAFRACPACAIDGKSTGRRTLTWEAAVLAAMPRAASRVNTRGRFHDVPSAWCADGVTPPENVEIHDLPDGASAWFMPGDATTREALRVMAHSLAEPGHVAVINDWCLDHADTAANFPGEPQGGLGELVTAWLRGECWWCNGGRRYRVGSGYVAKCNHCNGHGLVLGAFEHRLHHLAEVWCGPVHTAEAA